MRHLPWIIAVLVGAAIIVLAYPVLQTQRQLWSVESELEELTSKRSNLGQRVRRLKR